MSTTRPKTLPVVVRNIPQGLKETDQWAAWRWERRDGKWTKPPLNPSTGRYAHTNDPDSWGSFDAALRLMRKHRLPGVGFMFHPEDDYAGVDLDDCLDRETGEIEPQAQEIIAELGSYTEISPSETGLKVFVRGELPPGRRRKGQIEMYDRSRFFTTTGRRLQWVPASIRARQEELAALHWRIFGEPNPASRGASGEKKSDDYKSGARVLSDTEVIDRAMRAANGEKFARLWAGDTSDYRTASNEGRSEADLALCSLLAFWAGPDEARIDVLFRQSGLMRKKWYREDYRALTLAAALDREEFWGGDGAAFTLKYGKVYARKREEVSVG